MDIFNRCDLDGNGYLSRDEFDLFQMRSSGEMCDDDAWEVMKGHSLCVFLCYEKYLHVYIKDYLKILVGRKN